MRNNHVVFLSTYPPTASHAMIADVNKTVLLFFLVLFMAVIAVVVAVAIAVVVVVAAAIVGQQAVSMIAG